MVNLSDRFVDARFAILMISLEARMIKNEKKWKRRFARKESPSIKWTFVIATTRITDKKDLRKIRFSFIGTTGFSSVHFTVRDWLHVSNLFRMLFSIFFSLIMDQ